MNLLVNFSIFFSVHQVHEPKSHGGMANDGQGAGDVMKMMSKIVQTMSATIMFCTSFSCGLLIFLHLVVDVMT